MSVPVPLDPITNDPEDRRLWIGNLDSRVTEFLLLKLLQQYGSIEKFDLLFHRSGPLEGLPRGYAFVTYSTSDFAKIAQQKLNGKLLGSKALSVKWAHSVGKNNLLTKQKTLPNIPALSGAKSESKISKVTTIQAIEAKLKTMDAAKTSFDFEIDNRPSTSAVSCKNSSIKSSKLQEFNKHTHKQRPYLNRKCKQK